MMGYWLCSGDLIAHVVYSYLLINGVLRYRENYEFGLVRNAVHERRTLYLIAPHLVRPLNFILPMWKGPRASPFLVSSGLVVYDLLAFGSRPVQQIGRAHV